MRLNILYFLLLSIILLSDYYGHEYNDTSIVNQTESIVRQPNEKMKQFHLIKTNLYKESDLYFIAEFSYDHTATADYTVAKAIQYTLHENPTARYIIAVNILSESILKVDLLDHISNTSYDMYYSSTNTWRTLFQLGNLYPGRKICGSIDQFYPRISIKCSNTENNVFAISAKNPTEKISCSKSFDSIIYSNKINFDGLPGIESNIEKYKIISLCPFYYSYYDSTQFTRKYKYAYPELSSDSNQCKFDYNTDFWNQQDNSVGLLMRQNYTHHFSNLNDTQTNFSEFNVAPKHNMFYKKCDFMCSDLDKYEKAVDDAYLWAISKFPTTPSEKKVIAFSLYGDGPKYTWGAIRNAELANFYFPGWICRFYVSPDVPKGICDKLIELKAEIVYVEKVHRITRFIVAGDTTVDRFIIRDSDSRLNARDRFAVQAWIDSEKPIFSSRDHVNHCYSFNAGMWGGTKGSLPNFDDRFQAFMKKDEVVKSYMGDAIFLGDYWNIIMNATYQIDSYCCKSFGKNFGYPTRRPENWLHVGQVYDSEDHPRMTGNTDFNTYKIY